MIFRWGGHKKTVGAALIVILLGVAPCLARQGDEALSRGQGRQFTVSRLSFTGNVRTREAVLRRMIPLEEGEPFDYAKLAWGLGQINRSGLFEPVAPGDIILTFDDAKGVVSIELRLKERDYQRVDFSAGGGTLGSASVGVDYAHVNLTGRADSFAGRARVGNRERSFAAAYSTTAPARRPVRLSLAGFYQRLEFVDARTIGLERQPLFVQRTAGGSFALSLPLTRLRYSAAAPWRAGLGYSFTSTRVEDLLSRPPAGVGEVAQEGIRVASLMPSLTYNTLDRDFDPRRGRALSVTTEVAARPLGGSLNMARPSFDLRQFIPVVSGRAEPRVVGVRLRAAHVASFGEPLRAGSLSLVDGVPIFSRFFLGGEDEVRGYDVNSIAPVARVDRLLQVGEATPVLLMSDIRPVGGDTKLLLNAEYRVPLTGRLSAAAFFDLGGSFNLRRLREERFLSPVCLAPLCRPATLITMLRPLDGDVGRLPGYRVSLGGELRVLVPALNLPLRLIFAVNPNAQRRPPEPVLLAPERRFVFRVGFGRTL